MTEYLIAQQKSSRSNLRGMRIMTLQKYLIRCTKKKSEIGPVCEKQVVHFDAHNTITAGGQRREQRMIARSERRNKILSTTHVYSLTFDLFD